MLFLTLWRFFNFLPILLVYYYKILCQVDGGVLGANKKPRKLAVLRGFLIIIDLVMFYTGKYS